MKTKSLVKSILTLSLLSTLTMACSRPSAKQISQDIDTAIKINEAAKTKSEWENSENNNEAVVRRWHESEAAPEEVCKGLQDKSAKELALFEEELNSSEYSQLVTPCKEQIGDKLKKYWTDEVKKMETTFSGTSTRGSSFKFPDNTQTRDVSNGYKAVSGDVAPKEVILTFDDGPHSIYTDQILTAMKSVNAKAIFFTLGKNVKANPAALRRVAAGGHAIGSHSIDHKCLPAKKICANNNGRMLSFSEATAQIRGGHQAVENVLGWVDPFFRFPYGESSPELSAFLRENGVGEFFWSIDSEDWKNRTPSEMVRFTMDQLDRRGRGHLLFHDIQRKTAEALPTLLKELYYKGYSIVLLMPSDARARYNSKLVIKKGS